MKPKIETNKLLLKNTGFILSGNIISQAVALLSPIIITFLYEPDSYGEYSLIILIASLAATFFTLRLESLVLISDCSVEQNRMFSFCITNSIIFMFLSLFTVSILYIFSDLPPSMVFIPVIAFSISFQLVARELLFSSDDFKQEAKYNILRSLLMVLSQLALSSLSLGLLISKVISDSFYTLSAQLRYKAIGSILKPKAYVNSFKLYSKRSYDMVLSRVLLNISNNGLFYAAGLLFDLKTVGILALAMKAIQIPTVVIGDGLLKSLERQKRRVKAAEFYYVFKKFLLGTFVVSCVLFIITYIISSYNFFDLLPAKWSAVSGQVKALSPLLLVSIMSPAFLTPFKIVDKMSSLNFIDATESFFKIIVLLYFGQNKAFDQFIESYVVLGLFFGMAKALYSIKIAKDYQ